MAAVLLPLYVVASSFGSNAASLAVTPVRVNLTADGKPASIRVRNNGDAEVLVSLEARPWAEDIDAVQRTNDVLAVPPVFELASGAEQIIRVAARAPSLNKKEKAYRLLVTEVPKDIGLDNALLFSIRLNLPMFVTPEKAAPNLTWSLSDLQGKSALIAAHNHGTAHLRIRELKIGAALVAETATYILAGESKSWPLDTPLSALPDVVEVRAETNRGPLVAEVRPRAQ